jgi:ADP-ribose pyrophosphatase YjhB (NUDIX family)
MVIAAYKKSKRLLLAVDCIILGFDGKQLKALLVKRALEPHIGKWSLMGGFVKEDESVNDAASRVLQHSTGLSNIFMEQLHCFGNVERDSGSRVVSVAYYSLIKIDGFKDELIRQHNAQWIALTDLPELIFDHAEMIKLSLVRLQEKVTNHPVGFELLPHKFTLQQLQALYEAVYNTNFDKRNFTRKILSLNVLKKLTEKEKESSRKGAFLFVFDKKKYQQLNKQGLKFL